MMITVSDIKQFFYCQRIVYYRYCMPLPHKTTEKMRVGKDEHEIISLLEKRRSLRRYGLSEGKRHFDVYLSSDRLELSGILDLLIITPNGYFPVEYKYTSHRISENQKCQLAAYAMLVEDAYKVKVERGFIYRVEQKDIKEVRIDRILRTKVESALGQIRGMIASEILPEPTKVRARCFDCEYRKYCRDIL